MRVEHAVRSISIRVAAWRRCRGLISWSLAQIMTVSPTTDGASRMAQCGSYDLLGPVDVIVVAHEEWGIDFGAGLAVVTDDVNIGRRWTTPISRFAC